MARRNHRNARPQARRKADGSKGRASSPPPPIEGMAIPKGRCYFRSRYGKLRFTEVEVEKALRRVKADRARRGSTHAEERYYPCDQPGGCGDFHLTSRTEYTERGTT